jgi:hypothetical protein
MPTTQELLEAAREKTRLERERDALDAAIYSARRSSDDTAADFEERRSWVQDRIEVLQDLIDSGYPGTEGLMGLGSFNVERYKLRRWQAHKEHMQECFDDNERFMEEMSDLDSAVAKQAALGSFRHRLKDIARVCTNDPHADFWLQRRGDRHRVGRPMRSYKLVSGRIEEIGICVSRPKIVAPAYLYAFFEVLWRKGYWEMHSSGTLQLQHIRTSDVKNVVVTYNAIEP